MDEIYEVTKNIHKFLITGRLTNKTLLILKLPRIGFNILLHGVGSKKKLIQKFSQNHLANDYYVELLGYHHDFNTRNVRNIFINE